MNTLPKRKHYKAIKLQILNNEQLVQAVLDWNEDQYCLFKYEAGISYAKRMTDNDAIGFDFLIRTTFYWNWWKNEWAKRDADFLQYYSGSADKSILHDQYLFQHNIQRLKSDELMEKKACSMVGYCFDEFNNKRNRKELAK
jgi:hypothetical protein